MGKKIVILNGSPRPNGNTAALVAAFTKGATNAGHTITTFQLDNMHINGCKGCYNGGKNPSSPCVQKDDMDKIYPLYREADIIVLASPLYYWMFSGQLKRAFDRLFAVAESSQGVKHPSKECVLLMAAADHEFTDCISYYDNLMHYVGWKNRGKILAGGVKRIGDIEGHEKLAQAELLGKQI